MNKKLEILKEVAAEAVKNEYSWKEVVEVYGELKKEASTKFPDITKTDIEGLEIAKVITGETLLACGFNGDIESLLLAA